MTVFLAHALADEETADALARALERRGYFVEHEQPERIGRPLTGQDALVLLWSRAMLFEPGRLVMERRALDAWADGKLVVAALDRTMMPVGLRDLPAIDATFEQRRQFTWEEIAGRIRELTQASRPAVAAKSAPAAAKRGRAAPAPAPASASGPKSAASRGVLALLLLALCVAGLFGAVAIKTVTIPLSAVGAKLTDLTMPAWPLFLAAFVVLAGGALAIGRALRPRPPGAIPPNAAPRPAEVEEAAPAGTGQALFVSYAHADGAAVEPVLAAMKKAGRTVWVDNAGIAAGEGWAGEIVRAIRAAHGVLVMCSEQAFQSDHVKREVYLADRYKKPMLPVFIEAAELPEDFEYFFAGVQWLELHKTPETERAAALTRALAAV